MYASHSHVSRLSVFIGIGIMSRRANKLDTKMVEGNAHVLFRWIRETDMDDNNMDDPYSVVAMKTFIKNMKSRLGDDALVEGRDATIRYRQQFHTVTVVKIGSKEDIELLLKELDPKRMNDDDETQIVSEGEGIDPIADEIETENKKTEILEPTPEAVPSQQEILLSRILAAVERGNGLLERLIVDARPPPMARYSPSPSAPTPATNEQRWDIQITPRKRIDPVGQGLCSPSPKRLFKELAKRSVQPAVSQDDNTNTLDFNTQSQDVPAPVNLMSSSDLDLRASCEHAKPTKMALRLLGKLFSKEELSVGMVGPVTTGRTARKELDPERMSRIKGILREKFGSRLDDKSWARIKDVMNQKCRDASRDVKKQ